VNQNGKTWLPTSSSSGNVSFGQDRKPLFYASRPVGGSIQERINSLNRQGTEGNILQLTGPEIRDSGHQTVAVNPQDAKEPDTIVQYSLHNGPVQGTEGDINSASEVNKIPSHQELPMATVAGLAITSINKGKTWSLFSCFWAPKTPLFGLTLEESIDCDPRTAYPLVPTVLVRCIEYFITTKGYREVGVYRISPSMGQKNELQKLFQKKKGDVDLLTKGYWDVHTIVSIIKQFFRQLQGSIFHTISMDRFVAIEEFDLENKRIRLLQGLVQDLPDCYQATLGALFYHLKSVVDHQEINKMDANNMYIAMAFNQWTPGFPLSMFTLLVERADHIFPSSAQILAVRSKSKSQKQHSAPQKI
jgi:hypothetical protein